MKLRVIFLCFVGILLSGCVNWEDVQRKGEAISQRWVIEDRKINERLGERFFDREYDEVFDAVVLGLARANCISRSASKKDGFIFAESAASLLSGDNRLNNYALAIDRAYATATNSADPGIHFWGMGRLQTLNCGRDIVVHLTKVKTGVKVRIRISPQPIRYRTNLPQSWSTSGGSVIVLLTDTTPAIYPELLTDEINLLWETINRQVFLEKSITGTKN